MPRYLSYTDQSVITAAKTKDQKKIQKYVDIAPPPAAAETIAEWQG